MPITEGRNYAAELVGDNADLLPTGNLTMRVVDMNEVQSRAGYYMLTVLFEGDEPRSVKGLQHTEYFAVGYDEDPQAQLPETWDRRPGRRYCGAKKGLLACAGVDRTSNTGTDAKRLIGQRVGFAVTHRLEPDKRRDGTPNEFAGQPRAEIVFYRVGEREVGLTDEAPKVARAPRSAAPAAVTSPNGPAPSAVGGAPGGPLACPKCRQLVARDTFKEHVKACGTAVATRA